MTQSSASALRTKRLVLEPWSERDRSDFRRVCADPPMMQYMGRPGGTWTAAESDAVFDEALEHWATHGFGWRAAVEANTRRWFGFFVLNYVGERYPDLRMDDVSLGWWIVPSAWGNGYAVEGAERMRDEAFARLGVPRLFALIHPDNARSVRVAEKIGMGVHGRTVDRDGEPLLIYRMARQGASGPGLTGADQRGSEGQ